VSADVALDLFLFRLLHIAACSCDEEPFGSLQYPIYVAFMTYDITMQL
jgi:hypothetical protein